MGSNWGTVIRGKIRDEFLLFHQGANKRNKLQEAEHSRLFHNKQHALVKMVYLMFLSNNQAGTDEESDSRVLQTHPLQAS